MRWNKNGAFVTNGKARISKTTYIMMQSIYLKNILQNA